MNIAFQHYKEKLELEIIQFETIYGDLNNAIANEFDDITHTMLIEGQQAKEKVISAYQNSQQICEVFDKPDLIDLNNYERNLNYHNGTSS